MRNLIPVFALAAAAACSSSPATPTPINLGQTAVLGVGQSVQIIGSSWSLKFDSVQSDNRCPDNAICSAIAGGNATLVFELTNPAADSTPDNPHFTLGVDPVVVGDLEFRAGDLQPHKKTGTTINPRSYRASVQVVDASL